MFDTLNGKFEKIVRSIRGKAVISDSDLDVTMREIRIALLEADVALIVVKQFIDTVENLTIFIDKKENENVENLILKDSSNPNNIQLIIAKRGKIINEILDKYLVLNIFFSVFFGDINFFSEILFNFGSEMPSFLFFRRISFSAFSFNSFVSYT